MKPCEICNKQTSLYRCPRCFTNTCSLQCCVEHKTKNGCSGKRNRAAYCAMEDFTDSQLASDYHFLEDVLNVAQSGQRLLQKVAKTSIHKKITPPNKRSKGRCSNNQDDDRKEDELPPIQPLLRLTVSQPGPNTVVQQQNNTANVDTNMNSWIDGCSFKQQRLVQQANERGCTLLLMAPGMERQRNNTTFYNPKQDIISWKVDWVFHYQQQTATHRNETSAYAATVPTSANDYNNNIPPSKIIIHDNQVLETVILRDYILTYILQGKYAQSTLKPFCSILTLTQQSSSDAFLGTDGQKISANLTSSSEPNTNRTAKSDDEGRFPFLLFMKQIPCSSAKPVYIPLESDQTLKVALKGQTVIEYPTIDVVLRCDSHLIPCLVQEI